MPYIVDPNNAELPADTDDASYMAAEFRALKSKMATMIVGDIFTAGGTANAMTGTLPGLSAYTRVTCVPVGANTVVAPTLNGIVIVKYDAAGVLIPLVAGDYTGEFAFTFVFLPLGYLGADCWVLNLVAASASANTSVGAKRQTVLVGTVDSNKIAAALVDSGSATINLIASATDKFVMTCANGFGDSGPIDIIETISNTVNDIVTAPDFNTFFVYRKLRNSWGKTRARPQYGRKFNKAAQECLPLNGDKKSSLGGVWVAGASLTYSAVSPAIAGTSMAVTNGLATASLVRTFDPYLRLNENGWTFRFKYKSAAIGASIRPVFAAVNPAGYGVYLSIAIAGTLKMELSSTGTSWNIAAPVSTVVLVAGTSYDIEICSLGDSYVIYVDGVQQAAVTISALKICPINKFCLGQNLTTYNACSIQDFEYLPYILHDSANTFTPSTVLADVAEVGRVGDWFDIKSMKMFAVSGASIIEGDAPQFTEDPKLYVGEFTTLSPATLNIKTYAYNAEYDIGLIAALPAPSTRATVNHNLGVLATEAADFYFECTNPIAGYVPGERIANINVTVTWDVNTAGFSRDATTYVIPKLGGVLTAVSGTTISYGLNMQRGW